MPGFLAGQTGWTRENLHPDGREHRQGDRGILPVDGVSGAALIEAAQDRAELMTATAGIPEIRSKARIAAALFPASIEAGKPEVVPGFGMLRIDKVARLKDRQPPDRHAGDPGLIPDDTHSHDETKTAASIGLGCCMHLLAGKSKTVG